MAGGKRKARPSHKLAQPARSRGDGGHWRNLADGRRVFVRECEVGDRSRGGVVKDYEVAA
jgi:hypothetical protein